MQRREAELALYVREDLLARGQAVPDEIEQVFQAMKRQAAAQPEGGEKTAQMPAKKKARLQDLNKLASSEDTSLRAANRDKRK